MTETVWVATRGNLGGDCVIGVYHSEAEALKDLDYTLGGHEAMREAGIILQEQQLGPRHD